MLVDKAALSEKLQVRAQRLQLALSAHENELLIAYLEQLHKWNKAYNLSGIKDPEKMLSHHVLDSLSILPHITGESVADIGTGAGLPGMVLAICRPEIQFHLVDSNSKKTRFMFQTATLLGLKNVHVSHSRAEDLSWDKGVDMVISRAFASLADFVNSSGHLLNDKPGSRLLAMKGKVPDEELKTLPDPYYLHDCILLSVPGLDAERCVLDIRKKNHNQA